MSEDEIRAAADTIAKNVTAIIVEHFKNCLKQQGNG